MSLVLSRANNLSCAIAPTKISLKIFFALGSLLLFSITVLIVKFNFFGLLFLSGPLLLIAQYKFDNQAFSTQKAILHFAPFILFILLYFLTDLKENFIFSMYLPVFFLFVYGFVNLYILRNFSNYFKVWIKYNSWFQIFGAIGAIILILELTFDVRFSIDGIYFVISILLVSIFYGIMMFFIINNKIDNEYCSLESETRTYSSLQIQIEEYFEKNTSFLKPCFCFDDFVNDLQRPKRLVTNVLNQEMNTSFYNILAEKRIVEARRLLIENNGLLTIEALLGECGFNSKSSFNKHFKQQVGLTPSEYQLALKKEHK